MGGSVGEREQGGAEGGPGGLGEWQKKGKAFPFTGQEGWGNGICCKAGDPGISQGGDKEFKGETAGEEATITVNTAAAAAALCVTAALWIAALTAFMAAAVSTAATKQPVPGIVRPPPM